MNAQANTYNPASTGAFAAPIFGADARGCLITVKTPGEALPPAFKLKVAEAKTHRRRLQGLHQGSPGRHAALLHRRRSRTGR